MENFQALISQVAQLIGLPQPQVNAFYSIDIDGIMLTLTPWQDDEQHNIRIYSQINTKSLSIAQQQAVLAINFDFTVSQGASIAYFETEQLIVVQNCLSIYRESAQAIVDAINDFEHCVKTCQNAIQTPSEVALSSTQGGKPNDDMYWFRV